MSDLILARLDRIEKLITSLIDKQGKKTWVKVATIMEVTGWDREEMRRMRVNKVIKWKRDDGIWYLLESIPAHFIKVSTPTA